MKIQKLSEELISMIAAGEVIERPAYAVKELIENAIDAKARSIRIEIEESGLSKIAVYDDGVGMEEEDIKLSYLPHTTSKIIDEDDLTRIKTLGFRGEALSSIAAISTLMIESKTKKSVSGRRIKITKSKLEVDETVGMPEGTRITVENLFENVPARKKFLKTKQTEYRNILDYVSNFALSYPEVSFRLFHNAREIFNFPQNDDVENRVEILLGENILNNLFKIRFEESSLKVKGYLSRPQLTHFTSQKLFIFINGRVVKDQTIITAIKDAYENLLEAHSYPVGILFIDIPEEAIDVNVHPRKEIIKFVDPSSVYEAIKNGVKSALDKNNLTFFNLSWKGSGTNSSTAKLLKDIVLDTEIGQLGKAKADFKFIQTHNLYLVTETINGIMFIDQHAAHEAILYRKFKHAFLNERKKLKKLKLDKSILLNLSISDTEILRENITLLNQIGYEIQEFGDRSFKIEAIPNILNGFNIETSIKEFLDDIRDDKLPKDVSRKVNKMLSYLACRSAIKGGQHLEDEEIKKLIESLDKEDYVYTCPHGRPVKLEFSLDLIDKLFRRH